MQALEILEETFTDTRHWAAIDERPSLAPLPAFPLQAMPGILKPMTAEISESAQIQPEAAGLTLLITGGAAIGREHVFSVKRGLETRANIFGLVFIERAGRKSSAFTPALAPVYKWISERRPDYQAALSRLKLKQKTRDNLESKLTTPDGKDKTHFKRQYEEIRAEIARDEAELRDPGFITDDCTPEGLYSVFERCSGQAAIFSDDGRQFAKILSGKYTGGESAEEIHLRGYDCKAPIIKSRAKSSGMIEQPFEDALVFLQTDFLAKLAESEDLFSSGFMSRCLFCYPDPIAGTRLYSEREISRHIFRQYAETITGLLERNYSTSSGDDKEYSLDPDAKSAWIDFYNENERAIRPDGGELYGMADLATRYPEFARKLALICSVIEGRDTVSPADMSRAITLVRYYGIHAARVFAVMRKISLPEDARRTLQAIKRHQLKTFTARDLHRATGMETDAAIEGIQTLEIKGYCRPTAKQPEPDGAGRRPSPTYETNPQVFEKTI